MTLAFSFYNSVKKTLPGSFQKVEAAKKPKLMAPRYFSHRGGALGMPGQFLNRPQEALGGCPIEACRYLLLMYSNTLASVYANLFHSRIESKLTFAEPMTLHDQPTVTMLS